MSYPDLTKGRQELPVSNSFRNVFTSFNKTLPETFGVEEPLLNAELKKKGSGWLMTSFLMVSSALGIGILNVPSAYDQAGGILCATFIQMIMMCLMVSTMLVLAYCSDVYGDRTYHDVLHSMCGKRAQQLAALSITLTLYCVCVASLIVIGDQLDNLFRSSIGPNFCMLWYLDRRFAISAVTIVFILPLCFCKSVNFLGHIGSLGMFVMIYPVILTVYGYFTLNPENVKIKTKPDKLSVMFAMFPVFALGYQCHEVVVPIYSCMRNRKLSEFGKSSALAMLFLLLLQSVTGIFGYLTFGSRVAHNIMKMYDAQDPFVMVGTLALVFKMAATYPILALCGRDAVSGLFSELFGTSLTKHVSTENCRRYSVTTAWVISSLLLAVLTPSIGVVIKYLGAVASLNAYFYPGICLMQVVLKQDPSLVHRWSPYLVCHGILVAGVGAFCFGVVLLEAILGSSDNHILNLCDPSSGFSVPLSTSEPSELVRI